MITSHLTASRAGTQALFQSRPLAKVSARFGSALLLAATLSVTSTLQAQDADDANRRRRPAAGGAEDQPGRRAMTPEDMQARMATALRERLEITDDEEWKLISERIAKVTELRRTAGGPAGGMGPMAFGGRGGPGGGGPGGGADGANRGGPRGGRGGAPTSELGALQAAVRDKLPDAEIKARMNKLRETRKNDEAKLTKAQEDLRAVLTVRQEAVAVVFGLLP
jgi:Spy/CpxP family protein refolding chaperone